MTGRLAGPLRQEADTVVACLSKLRKMGVPVTISGGGTPVEASSDGIALVSADGPISGRFSLWVFSGKTSDWKPIQTSLDRYTGEVGQTVLALAKSAVRFNELSHTEPDDDDIQAHNASVREAWRESFQPGN